ncbi:MAG: 3-dehydroquinate synthase [Verrucomicrobiota bacterium]|nr:3-dehydroquinate synthase [Verrucomicrobiota bacterium]
MYVQRFSVPYEYPVRFTRGVFDPDNAILRSVIGGKGGPQPHRVMAFVDSGVARAMPGLIPAIERYFAADPALCRLVVPPQTVTGGEAGKSEWDDARAIMTSFGDNHMCRHSFVVAVGGGGALDMVGFACSLVHRGLRLIRIPTTVLAQNDAGVGVKNGMNERQSKNFVGAFAPPFAVVNDSDFLAVLPDREWRGGIAEAFKVAIIKDLDFFRFLCRNAVALRRRDGPLMEETIRRCAILHLQHIGAGGDPFEFGTARPLDFGHWSAHRLEMMYGYAIGHGQAVAIGNALDACYAMKKGYISGADMEAIHTGLLESGLPVWDRRLTVRNGDGLLDVLHGLEQFREHLGGELTLTMPCPLGRKIEIHALEPDLVGQGIDYLEKRSAGGPV